MAVLEASPFPNASTEQVHPTIANGTPRRRIKSDVRIRAGDMSPTLGADPSPTTPTNGHAHRPRERKKFSKRIKTRSLLRRTWTLPLLLILAFLFLYAVNPTESNIVRHFIFLSYKLQDDGDRGTPPQYGKGLWDIAFVSFYTVVLTFTREFVMQELLRPLARVCGIESRGKQSRFMEQMYTAFYIAFLGPLGVYVMSRTPVWYFNTRGMYESFPHKTHDAVFKFYYLFQATFWVQQAFVMLLGMEKPRKDFRELMNHHILTLALIGLSYRFHFTYMGIAVYITHDISDFVLAVSQTTSPFAFPRTLSAKGTTNARLFFPRHRNH